MKTFLTLILTLTISMSLAQWEWQYEIPPQHVINNFYFLDNQHGWAVGECGKLWTTNNGGFSWYRNNIEIASFDNLLDVCFVDTLNGWIIGGQSILHTEDGGKNWTPQEYEADYPRYLEDICFVDPMQGWILGWRFVLNTMDGGNNWFTSEIDIGIPIGGNIQFIDDSHGWICSNDWYDHLLYTVDGGENWESLSPVNGTYYDIFFSDTRNGWLACSEGLYRTSNCGDTWNILRPGEHCGNIQFIDSLWGWYAEDNDLWMTIDGGNEWGHVPWEISQPIFFVDYYKGWYVGPNAGIWTTNESGFWWNQQLPSYSGDIGEFLAIKFYDTNNGVAVSDGLVWKTSNGGLTWNPSICLLTVGFKEIDFFDTTNLLILTENKILQSVDGGIEWSIVYGNDDYSFTDLHIVDSIGFCFGGHLDSLFIFKSTDLGITWQELTLDTAIYSVLHEPSMIHFTDKDNGYLSGIEYISRDIVYHVWYTNDGGENWDESGNQPINFMDFTDSVNGYASGIGWDEEGGVHYYIYTTSDHGQTWEGLSDYWGEEGEVKDLCFLDKYLGWKIISNWQWPSGNYDNIYTTTDGGYNWDIMEGDFCNITFNDIEFLNPQMGWVAGSGGILHSNNAGGFLSVEDSFQKSTSSDVQCYPNPTSGIAQFSFFNSQYQYVTLKIYDLHGRKVATVVDEVMPAGKHSVKFDAGNLPTGVYIVHKSAISNQQSAMAKLVVLR